MNTIEEQIEILKAYQDGKVIECREPNEDSGYGDWEPLEKYLKHRNLNNHTPFDFNWFEYRIAKGHNYRPYMNSEELKAKLLKDHITFIKHKHKGNSYYNIQGFTDISIYLQSGVISYIELFNDYVWLDGSICGIKQN